MSEPVLYGITRTGKLNRFPIGFFIDRMMDRVRAGLTGNGWFQSQYLEVYLRATKRLNPNTGGAVATIDISSVTVRTRYEGKGHFSTLLREIEDQLPEDVHMLYVENANHRMRAIMERKNWPIYPYTEETCFYKLVERARHDASTSERGSTLQNG